MKYVSAKFLLLFPRTIHHFQINNITMCPRKLYWNIQLTGSTVDSSEAIKTGTLVLWALAWYIDCSTCTTINTWITGTGINSCRMWTEIMLLVELTNPYFTLVPISGPQIAHPPPPPPIFKFASKKLKG